MPAKPKYYWDACIFLAWIKDEGVPPRQPREMEGLAEIVDEIDSGRAILVTSTLTSTEVLDSTLTPEQRQRYNLVLKRPSAIRVNVDIRVSEFASAIRDYYLVQNLKVKVPDAIHMATAILVRVDELHTFDPDLLKFNGDVAGHALKICKPVGEQRVMKF